MMHKQLLANHKGEWWYRCGNRADVVVKSFFFVLVSVKMSEEALDEMSVLSAIFCGKGEFELIEKSGEANNH